MFSTTGKLSDLFDINFCSLETSTRELSVPENSDASGTGYDRLRLSPTEAIKMQEQNGSRTFLALIYCDD